ncbi:MAG: hypothetical protein ACFCBW_11520 [Candidatus Competibacterales bacterium]
MVNSSRRPISSAVAVKTLGGLALLLGVSSAQAQFLGNISAVGFAGQNLAFTACTIIQGPSGEALNVVVLAEAFDDPALDPVLFFAPVTVAPGDVQDSDEAFFNDDFSDNSAQDEDFIISNVRQVNRDTDSALVVTLEVGEAFCAHAFVGSGSPEGLISIQINDAGPAR